VSHSASLHTHWWGCSALTKAAGDHIRAVLGEHERVYQREVHGAVDAVQAGAPVQCSCESKGWSVGSIFARRVVSACRRRAVMDFGGQPLFCDPCQPSAGLAG
jgi:hypothetical protein